MTETSKGKIVIKGKIKNESPLHIGCGSDERSKMDILLDRNNKAFIPATALIGVLQHTIRIEGDNFKKQAKDFWGFSDGKEGRQSSIRCSDLTCITESPKVIRDGIKLNNKTGMVQAQGKYDYELLERGSEFSLKMEFSYTDTDESILKRIAATIFKLLADGDILIGAKTNNGMGKIKLCKEDSKIYLFDFSKKTDVLNWLTQGSFLQTRNLWHPFGSPFEKIINRFKIEAILVLKNSMIIRSYPSVPEMPDSVSIKSLDDWVLTGSSLKGVIRARANRITKTLGKSDSVVQELFGNMVESADSKKAKKGKVRIHEIVMPLFIAELQNRIKIDRFTGGTKEGALFDSMPLFQDESNKAVNLIIEVPDCKESEAGLLLLVLKDLWTGDLAVGGEKNVGRGVFKGTQALIEWNRKLFNLEDDFNKVSSETMGSLQQLVTAFTSEEQ